MKSEGGKFLFLCACGSIYTLSHVLVDDVRDPAAAAVAWFLSECERLMDVAQDGETPEDCERVECYAQEQRVNYMLWLFVYRHALAKINEQKWSE